MKSNVIRSIVTGACAVMLVASLTACGNSNEVAGQEVAEQVEDAAEQVEEVTEEVTEEMPNLEEEIQNVQDTLTFMGGLKTAEGADKAIDIAMFRNENGDIIYIYEEDGSLDYGMYTTETTTTEDGREYSKIEGGLGTYGYYFNEDLVTGIIVDTEGNVYDAVELDEAGAREYVSKTLGG
ncbi:MAG: hypothetical protein E7307_08275 [Butyrivibrio sp.]|nr:hypothetical protein [Butyrivibrio sp.]